MKSEPQLDVARGLTLISNDRLSVLWWAVKQTNSIPGMRIECGVYKGGSGRLIATATPHTVDLYDTFTGMPDADEKRDLHKKGDFADTSLEAVRKIMPKNVRLHPGFIPDTLEREFQHPIAFAHLDLDLYHSTLDALWNGYPRMKRGGIIVIDDYDWPETPGVTQAVDEFFDLSPEVPLVAAKYQVVIVKL